MTIKNYLMVISGVVVSFYSFAQNKQIESTYSKKQTSNMEKMHWFNEPKEWVLENNKLSMFVTPRSSRFVISKYIS